MAICHGRQLPTAQPGALDLLKGGLQARNPQILRRQLQSQIPLAPPKNLE